MPPIQSVVTPVDDRITIEIPKEYRAYSFAVTLTPISPRGDIGSTRRGVRRGHVSRNSQSGLSFVQFMQTCPSDLSFLDLDRNKDAVNDIRLALSH